MATNFDYYLILGIDESATAAQVRSAYRRAARAHHPDLNPGDAGAADRFKRVQQAYDVLSDPARRAVYRRPARTSRPNVSGGRPGGRPYGATAARPSHDASAWSHHPTAADPDLALELAEVLLALRILARQARLEQRLRRLVRYLVYW